MKTRAGKNRSKKLTGALLGLMIVASLTACGGSKQDTANPSVSESVETAAVKETTAATVKVAVKETTAAAVVEKPSGIQDDGMGPDPNYGEGIGEVIALSDSERAYVQEQTTNSWLAMEKMEKSDLVALMARLLEETKDYIVEDFDDLEYMLDRQMEQYFRNGVNEGVYDTVLDILGLK